MKRYTLREERDSLCSMLDQARAEVERLRAELKNARGCENVCVRCEAERRVLEACADCKDEYLALHARDGMGSAWVACVAEAELARRGLRDPEQLAADRARIKAETGAGVAEFGKAWAAQFDPCPCGDQWRPGHPVGWCRPL